MKAALTTTLTLATTFLVLALLATPAVSQTASAEEIGIPNEKHPEPGILFGGQPTAAHVAAMAKAGYKTIIDLRSEGEDRGFDEPSVVEKAGMRYVAIPVDGDRLKQAATYESFFKEFGKAEKPVVVHCASGNRVGGLYYAWLVNHEGVAPEKALAIAKEQGLRSEAIKEAVDNFSPKH